ncbi:glycosyltransferase family 2 protein [Actinoplanes sp. HUAS TT8]|uniref:glycosyltransferase family 2 protein n=1 Tax=Actinoplanes sp. HUAS TT8 TaxID=3447453 RepID=UPI003F51B8D6
MFENSVGFVAAAVRNRAVGLRDELARAALGPGAAADALALLLAEARAGRPLEHEKSRQSVQAVALLAQIMALQDIETTDAADALALFELLGPRRIPLPQRSIYAQLAGSARTTTDRRVRHEILTDRANPFRHARRSHRLWLRLFRLGLPSPGIRLDGRDHRPAFDRLCTAPVTPIERPELISVVVTAYRPGEGLLTAVRSILAQSWRNLEVLIVDDASPPEFATVLDAAVALDPRRVRVLRQASNSGTYVARNTGLDAATGRFTTFQDSDDWSHPRRLELQVTPLLRDPGLVASTSDGRRVTDDLTLTRLGRRGGKLNPSALLFRRDAVLETVGYLDVVRKGGDSEYIDRITAAFGARAVRHRPEHLALIRLSGGSLSRAEIRPYWIHPARAAYRSGYLAWHRRIASGEAAAFRPKDGSGRPFPAPPHLLRSASDQEPIQTYDVIMAADWRAPGETQRSALAEIEALVSRGLRVGILHLEDWRRPSRERLPVHHTVQDRVNSGRVGQVVLTDAVQCGLLLVRQAEVLRYPPAERIGIVPCTVLVLLDDVVRGGPVAEIFGVRPLWCPQTPRIRAAVVDRPLTDFDLPTAAVRASIAPRRSPLARAARGSVGGASARVPGGGASARGPGGGAFGRVPVVGAEITESGQLDRLIGGDVRIRVADGVHVPRQPADRLIYRASEVDPLEFLGQLDFYLDLSASPRSVLDATAMGCVVVPPDPDEIGRHQADPTLGAPERAALLRAHSPERFANRIADLARNAP